MQSTAKLSGYRQAPRKVRLVAGLVRGKPVDIALVELKHRAKRAAPVFVKLIESAVANARVLGLNMETLHIKELRVDKGPVLKRSRPRAQGRAFPIHKHTSHILVTLDDTAVVKGNKSASGKVSTEVKTEKSDKKQTIEKKSAQNSKAKAAKK